MASWGDINVALNRLVSQGVIGAFKTNRGGADGAPGLHVVVSPPEMADGAQSEEIRRRVVSVLEPVAEDITVIVDHSPSGVHSGP